MILKWKYIDPLKNSLNQKKAKSHLMHGVKRADFNMCLLGHHLIKPKCPWQDSLNNISDMGDFRVRLRDRNSRDVNQIWC